MEENRQRRKKTARKSVKRKSHKPNQRWGSGKKFHLHTTDYEQQLRNTLQVEAAGTFLGDVPCLSGTWKAAIIE